MSERMMKLGALMPERILTSFANTARYAGKSVDSREFVGRIMFISIVLGLIAAVASFFLSSSFNYTLVFPNLADFFSFLPFELPSELSIGASRVVLTFLGLLAGFGFILMVQWYLLDAKAEKRAQQVDAVLPDALQSIASNIKSGMTTEKALFLSARDEFGALSVELKTAARKILSGEQTAVALAGMNANLRSVSLNRTVDLLVEGIKSGGEISNLLLHLSTDLREESALQKETQANISMYIGLIFITAAFGAPILFGISTVIVGTISNQLSGASGGIDLESLPAGGGPLSGLTGFLGENKNLVTPEFIELFALLALLMTAIFSSLIMGIIKAGKEKAGVKSIPIILGINLVIFFTVKTVLSAMVGSTGL